MTEFEIEQTSSEKDLLIRSCKININGSKVITPTRTVSVTKTNDLELKVASNYIGNNYHPFGEVYAQLSLDALSQIKDDDQKGQEFSSQISNRLLSLKEKGTVPYFIISIVDNKGNPYNQTLPEDVLDLVYNLLWGTPGNSILVPPVTGLLSSRLEYQKLISSLKMRIEMNVERKNLPILAPIPSSYNLIDPKLLEEYWDIGCRMFAFNCDNKKYGALGYMVEKLHKELSTLSKKSEEDYILTALNTRFKIGKQDSSRINNLLGTGFGFDVYSPNHIIPKFYPSDRSSANFYFFDPNNYGFESLENITNGTCENEDILSSKVFKANDFGEFKTSSPYKLRKLNSTYNIEKSVKEVMSYSKLIDNEDLHNYLASKEKIKKEVISMKEISDKALSTEKMSSFEGWF